MEQNFDQSLSALSEQKRQLDTQERELAEDLRKLSQDKTLQQENRAEFNQRRLKLIDRRKTLNQQKSEWFREKKRVEALQQATQQTGEQLEKTQKKIEGLNRQIAKNTEQTKKKETPASPPPANTRTDLPQLGNAVTDSSGSTVGKQAVAAQAKALGEALEADSAKAEGERQGATTVVAKQAVESGISLGEELAEEWLGQYGKTKIDLTLGGDFELESYSIDYLMPYYNTQKSSVFMQLGYSNQLDRDILNIGLGYRRFGQSWMWGANVFLDSDLTLGHQRTSFGVEGMTRFVKGYSNVYLPLSDWQSVSEAQGLALESKAATGVDVGVEMFIGFIPGLSVSAEYSRWFGDHVDTAGGFEANATSQNYSELSADPSQVTVALEYRPIPLVGITAERTISEDSSDRQLSLDLTWDFDLTLAEQTQLASKGSVGSIESMRKAFVERESNIVLAYREKDKGGEAGFEVALQKVTRVTEMRKVVLFPRVRSSQPIVGYQWSGGGIKYLNHTTVATPTFTAKYWEPVPENNLYDLTLTVTDALGKSVRAEVVVAVLQDTALQPDITFYDSSNPGQPVTAISAISANSTLQLDCSVQSQRMSSGDSKGYTYLWEGEAAMLSSTTVANPEIDLSYPTGNYNLILTVQMGVDGESATESLPVIIAPSGGNPLYAGPDVTKVYLHNEQFTNPISGWDGGTLTYHSDDDQIASVVDSGEVTVHKAGQVRITVDEDATNVSLAESSSYLLTITAADSGLAWDNSGGEINSQNIVIKETDDADFQIVADSSLVGSDGQITYAIVGNPAVATVDPGSGSVQLLSSGVVKVRATQAKSANDSYLETEIEYILQVGRGGSTVMSWRSTQPSGYTLDAVFGQTAAGDEVVLDTTATGSVTYFSDTPEVVAVNDSSGALTVASAGSAIITAKLTNDPNFKNQQIYYIVNVDRATPIADTTVYWSGQVKHGSIVGINSINDPPPHITASNLEGVSPSYQSGTDSVASVDSQSGQLTLKSLGSTQIDAVYPETKNYLATTISYILDTLKQVGTPLTTINSSVSLEEGEFYQAMQNVSGGNGGTMTYTSDDDLIASIDPSSGKIIGEGTGSTTITVTELVSADYHEQSISFTIDVAAYTQKKGQVTMLDCECLHDSVGNVSSCEAYYSFGTNANDSYDPNAVTKLTFHFNGKVINFRDEGCWNNIPKPQKAGEIMHHSMPIVNCELESPNNSKAQAEFSKGGMGRFTSNYVDCRLIQK